MNGVSRLRKTSYIKTTHPKYAVGTIQLNEWCVREKLVSYTTTTTTHCWPVEDAMNKLKTRRGQRKTVIDARLDYSVDFFFAEDEPMKNFSWMTYSARTFIGFFPDELAGPLGSETASLSDLLKQVEFKLAALGPVTWFPCSCSVITG